MSSNPVAAAAAGLAEQHPSPASESPAPVREADCVSHGLPEPREVTLFREYVRVRSVHPTPDYAGVEAFIRRFAAASFPEGRVKVQSFSMVEGKPLVLLTAAASSGASKPDRPSVLLNSHSDVVPAEPKRWQHDPFAAHKDEATGHIFGRGTQDMKSCGLQHLLALERLLKAEAAGEVVLERAVHVLVVPDEEIGGHDGMEKFVHSEAFAAMGPIGVALDEGLASESDQMVLFYGERAPWWVKLVSRGATGHGSRFVADPAPQKLLTVVQRLLDFRAEQFAALQGAIKGASTTTTTTAAAAAGSAAGSAAAGAAAHAGEHCVVRAPALGEVTTVNLTALKAGVTSDGGETFAMNVVPSEASAYFDIRIPPSVNLVEFEDQLKTWCTEGGIEGVTYEFVQKTTRNEVSGVTDDDHWFATIRDTLRKECDIALDTQIFPAATDSRYLRLLGITAYGFSPINNTKILLHDHNEYLGQDVFMKGTDVMYALLRKLATDVSEQ